jgi:hypothetical protein
MADNEIRGVVILEADKASAAATQRLLQGVKEDIVDLGRANQLKGLGQDFDKFDSKVTEAGKRFQKLTEQINDTRDATEELAKTKVDAFDSIPEKNFAAPDSGGGGGGGNSLQQIGSQIRGLPSVQIPGLGIGTDAIGNLLRVGGAIKEASDKAKAAAAVTAAASAVAVGAEGAQAGAATGVAVTSTSAAAGMLALAIAAAPIAAIGAVIAAGFILIKGAMDGFSASAEENSAKVKRAYEAADTVFDSILAGDTSEEARKKIESEQLKREEADRQFSIAFQQSAARYAEIADKYGAAAAEIAKNRGTDEFADFANRMKEQQEAAKVATANIEEYNKALKDNKFAANDAKEAEEKRKQEQEKAAREAKQKEEQRVKDIENTEDRILDSNRKFAQKQEDDARQAAQKLEDIERGARDKRSDLQRKYSDDLVKIGLDANRDELDAVRKQREKEADIAIQNQQAEADAARKHQRTLDDIRQDAERSEQDQLRDRNFLAAALIGESAQRQVDDANKAAEQEKQDRAIQAEQDAQQRAVENQRTSQERQLAFQRARADRNTAYFLEQRDASIAVDRQRRDAEIAQLRKEQDTQLGYDREQAQLQEHMNKLLGIAAEGQAAERAIRSGGDAAQLRTSNTSNTFGGNTNINDYRAMTFNAGSGGGFSTIDQFKKIALQVQSATRYG